MNIIIAEEQILIRKKIRKVLEDYNHHVVAETDNGLITYNKYLQFQPDLILLSLTLPLLDGINTLLRIKKVHPEACVVILGEPVDKKTIFLAFEYGADHYLMKPVDSVKLATVLDEVIIMKDGVELCIK